MSDAEANPTPELKVVILAAGKETLPPDGKSILLQDLGSRKVVDYVIQNARQLVSSYDLYIVIGYQQEQMREHLGPSCQYIVQGEPLGTGHAVLQLMPLLEGYQGDLLILYGEDRKSVV
jgi:bifunctional UDP-N-acetylglucosamine pyrophosphorylase/glucosamine-1-phosphate N-acetyltransferase